jgi:hypothetical protein
MIIGGKGATVALCPGSVHKLNSTIVFTAQRQTLMTLGEPLGRDRALLVVEGENQATAVQWVISSSRGSSSPLPTIRAGSSQVQGGLRRLLTRNNPVSRGQRQPTVTPSDTQRYGFDRDGERRGTDGARLQVI